MKVVRAVIAEQASQIEDENVRHPSNEWDTVKFHTTVLMKKTFINNENSTFTLYLSKKISVDVHPIFEEMKDVS